MLTAGSQISFVDPSSYMQHGMQQMQGQNDANEDILRRHDHHQLTVQQMKLDHFHSTVKTMQGNLQINHGYAQPDCPLAEHSPHLTQFVPADGSPRLSQFVPSPTSNAP